MSGVQMAMKENPLRGMVNRFLQLLSLYAPGARTLRVCLHRMRGVKIGKGVFIGQGVMLEAAHPNLISIGNNVTISVRTILIGHFKGIGREEHMASEPSIWIEDNVFIGPNVTILPRVRIGKDAVVTAGSVVTRSVPPLTMVQGNPARVVAKCGVPLKGSPYKEFRRGLKYVNARSYLPQEPELE
jgi:acetyltransferase-like isoleucine patch superfamily enzyme